MMPKLKAIKPLQRENKYIPIPARHALLLEYYQFKSIPHDSRQPNALRHLCEKYGVHRNYPAALAKRAEKEKAMTKGVTLCDRSRSGRPPKLPQGKLKEVKDLARANKYLLPATELAKRVGGVSKSSICNMITKEKWRTTSFRSKPRLTDQHKAKRVEWATENQNQLWRDYVDIDEKYFTTVPLNRRIKVPPGEVAPRVPLQSKSNIKKLMVLCAVAKPRPEHKFDGKIGIWRIQTEKVAKKNSKLHKAGDHYKVDGTMDAMSFRNLMIQKVLPAIRRKMRWSSRITVQMDNAKPHVGKGNLKVLQKAGKGVHSKTRQVEIVCQPPQSPDTNILDLSIFRSLSTRVSKSRTTAVESDLNGLMSSVRLAYRQLPTETLEKAWSMKKRVLGSINLANGDNDYVLPHSK